MSNFKEQPDAKLVSLVTSGEKDAYRELVARYQGHVYGLAYSLVGNWAEAQDIAQETFIRCYSNLDQLRDPAKFAAWLRRVAFGVTMDWLKAFRPKLFASLQGQVDLDNLDIPDFQPGPAEVAEKKELAEAVLAAVASLPPKYRVPLTMFHLDGLSYQKVADFLDIPLGTAKSLVSRAQAKLRAALESTMAPEGAAIQEVFNEHKLPAEFASKVLHGVGELRYVNTECTFCGSVCAYMEYIGAPVPYEFIMAVSGSAFKLLWYRTWCPSNNTLLVLAMEPVKRTFSALGYSWQFVPKARSCEGDFRAMITASINEGRPVLTEGIVGPVEVGIITGFDQNGDIILGRSFFHDSREYYRKKDWYKDCQSLLLIGSQTRQPDKMSILRNAMEWAVMLARGRDITLRRDYAVGLAAYDEWAAAMLRDGDFPSGDLKALTRRCNVSTGVTLAGLYDARRSAAWFLRSMADVATSARPELAAAAQAYEQQVTILHETLKYSPDCSGPRGTEEMRLGMADRRLRERIAGGILAAKEQELCAVEHLEKALSAM